MKNILFGLLIVITISCGYGPIRWKGFTNYTKSISDVKMEFIIDGIYVQTDSLPDNFNREYFFLYRNGKCEYGFISGLFWNKSQFVLEQKKVRFFKFRKNFDDFGHYRISNDTINLQTFGGAADEFYSKSVIEQKALITSNYTFTIFEYYSYNSNETILEKKNFKFYRTNIKPDSSNYFYKNKKWYQRNLHSTRR